MSGSVRLSSFGVVWCRCLVAVKTEMDQGARTRLSVMVGHVVAAPMAMDTKAVALVQTAGSDTSPAGGRETIGFHGGRAVARCLAAHSVRYLGCRWAIAESVSILMVLCGGKHRLKLCLR